MKHSRSDYLITVEISNMNGDRSATYCILLIMVAIARFKLSSHNHPGGYTAC